MKTVAIIVGILFLAFFVFAVFAMCKVAGEADDENAKHWDEFFDSKELDKEKTGA